MRTKEVEMILAGDIGGTHTRLGLFEKGEIIGAEEKFFSRQYGSFEEILQKFLEKKKQRVERACFGVAGPVRDGKCKITNLSWIIDAAQISRVLQIPSFE